MADLNSRNRDCIAQKVLIIYDLVLHRNSLPTPGLYHVVQSKWGVIIIHKKGPVGTGGPRPWWRKPEIHLTARSAWSPGPAGSVVFPLSSVVLDELRGMGKHELWLNR